MCDIVFERSTRPWLWSDFLFYKSNTGREHDKNLKILKDFTKKVINERNSEFENNNCEMNKRVAFLDMLLKAKHDDSSITFDDIQEEVDTFMFEGHDTTTSASGWACHLIGSHPRVQKKLQDEIEEIFGNLTINRIHLNLHLDRNCINNSRRFG
jgi:cytochrome P450